MRRAEKASIYLVSIIILAIPGIGTWLESSMMLHVVVQLPLLILLGWGLGELIPQKARKWMNAWNELGVPGVLLMSGTGLFWMLPSTLDASLEGVGFTILKVFSMVVLIGVTLSITSSIWNPILKGVFLLEVWAMLGRFGYGYIVSPDRLCANYLFNEQQMLGEAMLWIAAVWALYWSSKVVLGIDVLRMKRIGC